MGNWDFQWFCQWRDIFKFRRMNWINFDFIHIAIEVGSYTGRYCEFAFTLLGIGVVIEWHDPTTRSVFLAHMDQRIAEARDNPGDLLEL